MFNTTLLKKSIIFILIFAFMALSSACSQSSNTSSSLDNEGAVASPEPTEGYLPEDNINSNQTPPPARSSSQPEKTAEPYKVDFKFPKEGVRPYAVMIDNEGTKPLPQGGLNLAQVVYEIIVEGGVTRLMPVFWEQEPTLIGPVRSSRHYFLDYSMENDAIYVHFGYSPMAYNDIPKFKINNINGVANGGEVFWDLTKDRGNWQDSYTSMEKARGYVKKVKYRTSTEKNLVFKYSDKDAELKSDKKAEKITLKYSTSYKCSYTYDSEKKLYMRFRQGQPHMERVSGEQLTAKNIIIQKVRNYTIKGDQYGRQEVDTVGSGEGFYITEGKYIKITWSKASRTDRTKYQDSKGNEIALNPGQTWVQIFPVLGKLEIE